MESEGRRNIAVGAQVLNPKLTPNAQSGPFGRQTDTKTPPPYYGTSRASRAVVPAIRVSPRQAEEDINFSIHAFMALTRLLWSPRG